LLAVKRELDMEAVESGLLSFTRVASGCEGLSLGPDVIWVISHQTGRKSRPFA